VVEGERIKATPERSSSGWPKHPRSFAENCCRRPWMQLGLQATRELMMLLWWSGWDTR